MSTLAHPHIPKFHGIVNVKTNNAKVLVMEYVPHSLDQLLYGEKKLITKNTPWKNKFSIVDGTAQALAYLHGHNPPILHRDVKSANILIDITNDGHYIAKLTDFGLSKAKQNSESGTLMKGSFAWMAPEMWKKDGNRHYTVKVDIFSLGMVMTELANAKKPSHELEYIQEVSDKRTSANPGETIPETTPVRIAHLIQWCSNKAPDDRPTSAEVVEDITEINNTPGGTVAKN